MLITAEQKNTRQTPRKVRLVANLVKNMPLEKALRQLSVVERKATIVVLKVIRQAMANAIHNHRLNPEDLMVKNVLVTEGPRYKRFRAVSRGRAHNVIKRTCHVKVVLESTVQAEAKAEVKNKAKTEKVKKEAVTKNEVKATSKSVTTPSVAAPVIKKVAPQKAASIKTKAGTTNIRRGTK